MIEIKQAAGKTKSGRTVAHDFDRVIWVDGEHRRYVAHLGHDEDAPIQWRESVPEAVQAEVRAEVKKRKEQRKRNAAGNETTAASTG